MNRWFKVVLLSAIGAVIGGLAMVFVGWSHLGGIGAVLGALAGAGVGGVLK